MFVLGAGRDETMYNIRNTAIRIYKNLFEVLEKRRGRIPHSVYICDVLREHFGIPLTDTSPSGGDL